MLIYLLLLAAAALIYLWQRHRFAYWSRRRFVQVAPSFPLGNLLPVLRRDASFSIYMMQLYRDTTEPLMVGLYFFLRPALLIKDATLARRILTQDFQSFHDRGTYHNPEVDPLSGHMFNMCGTEWRAMRTNLTPTFTSGKLRSMMPTILAEGDNLKRYLVGKAAGRVVVPMKELIDK